MCYTTHQYIPIAFSDIYSYTHVTDSLPWQAKHYSIMTDSGGHSVVLQDKSAVYFTCLKPRLIHADKQIYEDKLWILGICDSSLKATTCLSELQFVGIYVYLVLHVFSIWMGKIMPPCGRRRISNCSLLKQILVLNKWTATCKCSILLTWTFTVWGQESSSSIYFSHICCVLTINLFE